MNIKIQIEKNLLEEDVIGAPVTDENDPDTIIGEAISYDPKTGIAICEMKKGDEFHRP